MQPQLSMPCSDSVWLAPAQAWIPAGLSCCRPKLLQYGRSCCAVTGSTLHCWFVRVWHLLLLLLSIMYASGL